MQLPHWRRVLWMGTLTVLIVFGALFYILFLHRTKIDLAYDHPRAVPPLDSLPAVRACWVETASVLGGTPLGSTASVLLIRHPAGDVLVDAGNSSRFDEEIRAYEWRKRFWLQSFPGALKPRMPLPELLRSMGVNVSRLMVILSHAHLDHAGGLMDLPFLPVLLPKEEKEYMKDPENWERGFVMPAHAVVLASRIATIEFVPQPYEFFDRSYDLFRDGSVVIVPLFGHTPGSVGVFVNLSAEKRLLHIGDATDDVKGYEKKVGKSLVLQVTDADPAKANAVVAQLNFLHEKIPALNILPAHGRTAWERAFPQGPGSCIAK